MADDTTVLPSAHEPAFEPEPIPESIADTELNGLNPDDSSTEPEQVEPTQDETNEEQPEEAEQTDAAEEPGEPDTQEAETTEEPVAPTTEQPENTDELTGVQRRLAEKAQRDYVNEQRQQIRQYKESLDTKERTGELDDMELIKERQRVIEANQYVDTVERNRMSVMNEGQRALQEIPFFKNNTPEAAAAFSQAVDNFKSAYGVYDEETNELVAVEDRQGNPVSLYNYLEQQAAVYDQVAANRQRQAQQSEAKMRAKAVTPSNPGKVTSSGDELDDLLERIGDIPLV